MSLEALLLLSSSHVNISVYSTVCINIPVCFNYNYVLLPSFSNLLCELIGFRMEEAFGIEYNWDQILQ